MFLILGICAKVWSESIAARELDISALLASESYLFLLLTAIGAMVGFVSSYLADLCLKIKSEKEEIGLNLSEYFLPVIGFHEFDEMEKQQVDDLIHANLELLPDDFLDYLERKGVIVQSQNYRRWLQAHRSPSYRLTRFDLHASLKLDIADR